MIRRYHTLLFACLMFGWLGFCVPLESTNAGLKPSPATLPSQRLLLSQQKRLSRVEDAVSRVLRLCLKQQRDFEREKKNFVEQIKAMHNKQEKNNKKLNEENHKAFTKMTEKLNRAGRRLFHTMRPGRWKRWRAGKLDFVWGLQSAYCTRIPRGRFLMGSPKGEVGRDSDEGPQRWVTISRGFCMMDTEVTQAQFHSLMGYSPSLFQSCGKNCPVEKVNWHEAAAFANALSRKQKLPTCFACTGKGKASQCQAKNQKSYTKCRGWRLPTEAEWEYAARAGTTTALYTGGLTIKGAYHGPELDTITWYGGNSGVGYSGGSDCKGWSAKQYPDTLRCGTHPVAGKLPNSWGLYDVLGNVWEWTFDRWVDNHSGGDVVDPIGHKHSLKRAYRGGGYTSLAKEVRAARRVSSNPSGRSSVIGFRLLRTN